MPLLDDLATVLRTKVAMINNSQALSTFHSHFQTNAHLESLLIFLVTFQPLPRTGMTNLGCGIVLKGETYGGHHHMAGEIAVGVPHPLKAAAVARLGKVSSMRNLLAKSAMTPGSASAIWDPFCRDFGQIVSRSMDLINPDLTLICSDLPELESLIGEKLSRQIATSTVMGKIKDRAWNSRLRP